MVKQGEIIKVNLNLKPGHEQLGCKTYMCLSHELVNTTSNITVFALSVTPLENIHFMLSWKKLKQEEKYY